MGTNIKHVSSIQDTYFLVSNIEPPTNLVPDTDPTKDMEVSSYAEDNLSEVTADPASAEDNNYNVQDQNQEAPLVYLVCSVVSNTSDSTNKNIATMVFEVVGDPTVDAVCIKMVPDKIRSIWCTDVYDTVASNTPFL